MRAPNPWLLLAVLWAVIILLTVLAVVLAGV
jgi:hypothetical protein